MSDTRRVLWIWTPRQLSHREEKKALFALCRKNKFNHIYYQAIFSTLDHHRYQMHIEGQEYFRDFIREAHENKIKVFALQSRPNAVLQKSHGEVMAEIKALVSFNQNSRPEEQFDGVHYAFNLYLLEAIGGKNLRAYLVQMLQICKRVRNYLYLQRPKLILSVDMPFWFLTEGKGPLKRLIFDLRWQEAGEHLLNQVDEVVVFPYRNYVAGEDGLEALTRPAIEYAKRTNKKVVIGLETMNIPSSTCASFAALGNKELHKAITLLEKKFKGNNGFAGIGVHDYENYSKIAGY